MPTYAYLCADGHRVEIYQNFHDKPLELCPEDGCGMKTRRIIRAVPIIYKGSGFYTTDKKDNDDDNKSKSSSGK